MEHGSTTFRILPQVDESCNMQSCLYQNTEAITIQGCDII